MIALVVAFLPLAISMWLTNRLSRRSWSRSGSDSAQQVTGESVPQPDRQPDRRPDRPPQVAMDEPVIDAAAPPDWTALDDIQLDRLLKDSQL